MFHVLLVIQVLVTLALVAIILIQRSESDGLGGLGGGGGNSFMTGRGAANLMTKTTAILATVFMALSLALAIISSKQGSATRTSIVDQIEASEPSVPDADAPLTVTPPVAAPVTEETPANAVTPTVEVPVADEPVKATAAETEVAPQDVSAEDGAAVENTDSPATIPNP